MRVVASWSQTRRNPAPHLESPRGYGTEGQRFESSRARSPEGPAIRGVFLSLEVRRDANVSRYVPICPELPGMAANADGPAGMRGRLVLGARCGRAWRPADAVTSSWS